MATMTEIRTDFRRESGRAELSTTQIDAYINKGQRYLDEITDFQKAPQKYEVAVIGGQVQVIFPADCRVVQQVWIADTVARTELSKIDELHVRRLYDGPINAIERSRPIFYVPDSLMYNNATGLFAWGSATLITAQTSNGILILPPPEKDYTVEIQGRFYSPILSDTQASWWLRQNDGILLMSTLRAVEIFYRNTQGVRDWDNAMARDINSIQDDLAEEEGTDISRMEG